MKQIASVLIVAALCATFATPTALAQTNGVPERHWARQVGTNGESALVAKHHGTNNITASHIYQGMTNVVTATGTLIVEQLAEVENPTTHKPMLMQVGASETSGGKQMTCYRLLAADGSSVTSFGAETAATSPVKVGDYIDQFVTIVGWGRELPGKAGKLIQIRKITSITRNAASQPATANP